MRRNGRDGASARRDRGERPDRTGRALVRFGAPLDRDGPAAATGPAGAGGPGAEASLNWRDSPGASASGAAAGTCDSCPLPSPFFRLFLTETGCSTRRGTWACTVDEAVGHAAVGGTTDPAPQRSLNVPGTMFRVVGACNGLVAAALEATNARVDLLVDPDTVRVVVMGVAAGVLRCLLGPEAVGLPEVAGLPEGAPPCTGVTEWLRAGLPELLKALQAIVPGPLRRLCDLSGSSAFVQVAACVAAVGRPVPTSSACGPPVCTHGELAGVFLEGTPEQWANLRDDVLDLRLRLQEVNGAVPLPRWVAAWLATTATTLCKLAEVRAGTKVHDSWLQAAAAPGGWVSALFTHDGCGTLVHADAVEATAAPAATALPTTTSAARVALQGLPGCTLHSAVRVVTSYGGGGPMAAVVTLEVARDP
jgi:hypothetical protein